MSPSGIDIACRARVGALTLDVALHSGPGTLVIVGPNGAGKTTLLDIILGVRTIEQGRIAINGDVVADTASDVHLPLEQRRLGYLPQDYGLFPHLTAGGNIRFAIVSSSPRLSSADRANLEQTILGDLGVASLAHRGVASLSGGEKQRVALARALATQPHALLLDEPLAALDVHSRDEVRRFLAAHLKRANLPTLIVTHDGADAYHLGDRIAVLEAGRVTQLGTWAELARCPATPFVASLVSRAPQA